MFEIFQWTSGDYEITTGSLPEQLKSNAKITSFAIDTNDFLTRAIESAHRWNNILRTIDPVNTPLEISAENIAKLDDMGLPAKAIEDARYIDGSRSIMDIAAISTASRFEFIETIHRLVTSNMASGDKVASKPEPEPTSTPTNDIEPEKQEDEPLLSLNLEDGSTRGLIEEAQKLVAMGEKSSAIVIFKKAIRASIHENDFSTARDSYIEYLETAPEDHETFKQFITFGSENPDHGASEGDIERIIQALAKSTDVENGEKSFQQLLALFPNKLEYHIEYAKFLDNNGNFKKALSEFEHVRASADAIDRPELAQAAMELMKNVQKPSEPISETIPPDGDTEELTIPLIPEKGKSRKKDLKLVIGLILILLAGGGYFAYSKYFQNSNNKIDPAILKAQEKARLEAEKKKKEEEEKRQKEAEQKRKAKLEAAKKLEKEGKLKEAVAAYLDYIDIYEDSEEAMSIKLPVKVDSFPSGCNVTLSSTMTNESVTAKTPAIMHFPAVGNCAAIYEKENYEPITIPFRNDKSFQEIHTELERKVLWKEEKNTSIETRILVHENRLFASSRTGELFCININSGTTEWKIKTGKYGDIMSSPVRDGKHIFSSSSTGLIKAVELAGTPNPINFNAPQARGIVAVNDLYLVSTTVKGEIFIFERLTGKTLCSGSIKRAILTGATGSGDQVFFGCADNHIYSLDVEGSVRTGTLKISSILEGDTDFSNALHLESEHLYAVSKSGRVYCVKIADKSVVWEFSLPGGASNSLATDKDHLCIATTNGNIVVLNKKTGTKKWNTRIGKNATGITTHEEMIYSVSLEGILSVHEINSGNLIWKYDTGRRISAPPAVEKSTVCVTTTTGEWLALPAGK